MVIYELPSLTTAPIFKHKGQLVIESPPRADGHGDKCDVGIVVCLCNKCVASSKSLTLAPALEVPLHAG